ncbi:MAG: hypothetical protein IT374_27780 [Polyangiaceae bacterium]|nr:hypothetical protein [Polyangiaceae bacterium]
MAGSYTTQVRVLLCAQCGAPIEVSPNGGLSACRYCGAQLELAARSALPAFAPPVRAALSEPERLARLRMQDNRPLLPPQSIAHLFGPGGQFPEWKEQEVFAAWQSARKRTATGALDAAEELFFLTEVLGNKAVAASDLTRHRAMLESALEAFTLPRHRSSVAASLVLAACREGDLQGASTWLQLVDPASDDLYADSMYRVARSRVATKQRDFQGVLAVLGQSSGDWPTHDALDCIATVYRANAYEGLGRLDLAVRELTLESQKSGQHRASIATIVRLHGVCQQSFAQADVHAGAQAAVGAAAQASAGVEKVFMPLGAVFAVIGVIWVVTSLGGAVFSLVMTGSPTAVLGGIGSSIGGVVFVAMGVGFFFLGRKMAASAQKAGFIAQHGKRANGTILGVEGTGMKINGVPQVRVRMRVEGAGAAPYEVQLTMLMSGGGLAPGLTLPVRVHPTSPTDVVLDV